jgi:hypothetical protein
LGEVRRQRQELADAASVQQSMMVRMDALDEEVERLTTENERLGEEALATKRLLLPVCEERWQEIKRLTDENKDLGEKLAKKEAFAQRLMDAQNERGGY